VRVAYPGPIAGLPGGDPEGLDQPSVFTPGMAIFTVDQQAFHHVPAGIPSFERLPG